MPEPPPPRPPVDAAMVARLVAAQFPDWADLPVSPVAFGGKNNLTFHLGETMSVRLPAGRRYVAQVEKEQVWLPRLAPHLPLPVPRPLAFGAPGEGYPYPWSVRDWIPGETAATGRIDDLPRFADDLAGFLKALHRVGVAGGPLAGEHNFFRGGPLSTYDAQTRQAILDLEDTIDSAAAEDVWTVALASSWADAPVWVHGDIAAGNLLVAEGRLSAVIDFGILGVGDPACDLVIAWTFLDGPARAAFRAALPLDETTWARARGWALWKALIVAAGLPGSSPAEMAEARGIIRTVLADHHGESPPAQ